MRQRKAKANAKAREEKEGKEGKEGKKNERQERLEQRKEEELVCRVRQANMLRMEMLLRYQHGIGFVRVRLVRGSTKVASKFAIKQLLLLRTFNDRVRTLKAMAGMLVLISPFITHTGMQFQLRRNFVALFEETFEYGAFSTIDRDGTVCFYRLEKLRRKPTLYSDADPIPIQPHDVALGDNLRVMVYTHSMSETVFGPIGPLTRHDLGRRDPLSAAGKV